MESLLRDRIVFSALETYSLVGGLQNFNRRVIRNLVSRAEARGSAVPRVHVLRDGDTVPTELLPFVRSYSSRLWYMLRGAVAAMNADVFIIGHVNLLPLAGLVRCLRPRLSILLFVHGDEVWNEPKRRQKRWYDKPLLRAVDVIASVSQYTADVMSRQFGLDAAKFEVFPNAVDEIEADRGTERNDEPIILTVSRMSAGDRDKNIHQMLRAVAILKKKLPRVQYHIVGDGSLRSEYEKLSRELDIDENVSFLGRVSDAELSQVYQRASVFAMPSSKEGFGIVYLEAWLYSLPVICSTFGASKEIVSDGIDGFVVDHRDERQLAERLHQLLTNKMLAMELGRNGRIKVQTKYLNSSFRSNLEALLEKTLRRSSTSE